MKLFTATLIVMLLLCISADAQVKVFGLGGYGRLWQPDNENRTAIFVGFDIPILTDSATGYSSVTRMLYYQQKENTPGHELQAAQVWSLHSLRIAKWLGAEWYFKAAFGFQNTFNDSGDDDVNLGLKIEPGVVILKRLGISVGFDLVQSDEAGDKKYLYLLLSFSR